MRLDPGVHHPAETRLLRVAGADAAAWLQALATQDLAGLTPGASRLAALADDRAHYLAHFWVWRGDAEWWLEVDATRVQALQQRLERFVISEDVEVADAGFDGVHVEGRQAVDLVATTVDLLLPPNGGMRPLGGGVPGVALRRSLYGDPGVTVFAVPGSPLVHEVIAAARAHGFRELDRAERTRRRIEAGRPLGGVDVGEEDLLPEAGLADAVSLDKGCFPGQEIVRRVAVRGRLRRRLAGVRFQASDVGEALAGAALHPPCAPQAGRVTSAAAAPERAETVALAWIAAEYAQPGTPLVARGDFGEVAGAVAALPMERGAESPAADVIRYPEEAA